MKYHPRRRPSLRLSTYDYTQPGGYYITICTQHRRCLFGSIENGELRLNPSGLMVEEVWSEIPERFAHISLDPFVVMPNHLHGIVCIAEQVEKQGLGQIIGAFKSLATTRYINGVHSVGWPPFSGRLWQDNYFEHVIRDERALEKIRAYIVGNPAQWESDPERPR